jgi:hypothetical protein
MVRPSNQLRKSIGIPGDKKTDIPPEQSTALSKALHNYPATLLIIFEVESG